MPSRGRTPNQFGNSQPHRALSTKDKVVLDIRRGCDGTQLTVRMVRGRLRGMVLMSSLAALIAMAFAFWQGLMTQGAESASVDIAIHICSGDGGAVPMTRELTAGRGRAVATRLLMLAASAGAAWELFQVTSESVLVLAGGVGYILESVRRCGLRRQRFLDAQDVSYVALNHHQQ
ncbi:hypothetical protein Vafri_11522 [Volvox africanus]|nr:hypothetical protein Vafri_11522 [Volvox africanus]